MTAAEKILARTSGRATVKAGDIVYPRPDFVMIHDGVVRGAKEELNALGITQLFDPDRVLMVTDHDVVYVNDRAAARGAFNRKAAEAWGVKAPPAKGWTAFFVELTFPGVNQAPPFKFTTQGRVVPDTLPFKLVPKGKPR